MEQWIGEFGRLRKLNVQIIKDGNRKPRWAAE